jgi:hypothetical protein
MSTLVIRIPLHRISKVRASRRATRYLDAERVAGDRVVDIARHLGVPSGLVCDGRRAANRKVRLARLLAAYTLRHYEGLSYPEIARALGFRDHTSALYLVRRVEETFGDVAFEVQDAASAGSGVVLL